MNKLETNPGAAVYTRSNLQFANLESVENIPPVWCVEMRRGLYEYVCKFHVRFNRSIKIPLLLDACVITWGAVRIFMGCSLSVGLVRRRLFANVLPMGTCYAKTILVLQSGNSSCPGGLSLLNAISNKYCVEIRKGNESQHTDTESAVILNGYVCAPLRNEAMKIAQCACVCNKRWS